MKWQKAIGADGLTFWHPDAAELRERFRAVEAPGGYAVDDAARNDGAAFRTLKECGAWVDEVTSAERNTPRITPAVDAPARTPGPASPREVGFRNTEPSPELRSADEKKRKKRSYAPGWRRAGAPVDAKLRRSERGFKRGERVIGVWDEVKGAAGMWVHARSGAEPYAFLVGSVALADTRPPEPGDLLSAPMVELLRAKGGKSAPTHKERAEIAQRNGKRGGRPKKDTTPDLFGDTSNEVKEVVSFRLPVSVIEGAKALAAAQGEKYTTWMALAVASTVNAGRKSNG